MDRMKSLHIIFGLMLAAGAATAQQYTISTIAGIGNVQGYFGDGGPATSAQLDFPLRVAVDSKGNYYFADFLTNVVREVAATGTITTIAGTGSFGFQGDNGPGVQGVISDVHGVAVDSNLNVYLADTHNSRIRKITPTGNIFTIAGNGTFGYSGDGGAATSAALTLPAGVAVDSAGNVYIADYGNSTVRKVDAKGNISTIAGTGVFGFSGDGGPANKALLAAPYALALDPAGNLYISDLGNTGIRKITSDGNIQTVISNLSTDSIAVDASGSIYFTDYQGSTVQKQLANGTRFAIAGTGTPGYSGDGGAGTSAQLNQPYGVALDSAGNVYVADSQNQVIRLLKPVASSISVVNAASGVGTSIAPGEIVTIYGTSLGPTTPVSAQPGSNGIFGTQLAGTTVSFGGTNAPIIYTSATQVSAVVPYALVPGSAPDVTVSYQGQSFTEPAVPVSSSIPGVFTLNASGSGQATALNLNGSVNGTASPAKLGSFVTLYVTGEGQTNPAGVDGKPATNPLPAPLLPVFATLAGQPVTVQYAGAAPGSIAGLMQVNLQIPANLIQTFSAAPVAVPVVITVGFVPSQPNVTITVAP
jgi:uncharacterized protein (TIGR03437 family)